MKTILILLDSLNRPYLGCYGNDWVKTPNIDRLAQRGVTFENHYCGSMPCMPARREFLTGRLNFLECPWGPLEPPDATLPALLRDQQGTYSHMITDHYHYFQANGANYHTPFNTWEFIRGQEGDAWHPKVAAFEPPAAKGKNRRQDWVNRERMDLQDENQYPTPQCFRQAIEFLKTNGTEDNWHLHLECFDPHEPFLAPDKYRDMYGARWHRDYIFDWPPYAPVDEEDGPEAVEYIRKLYAATLTMTDAWLGKLMDTLDELDLWDEVTVILTTDHGHLLGEHGYWAKNYMFVYQQLANVPMIVAGGGVPQGQRRRALTANMDVMPTLMDLHGGQTPQHVHGRSIAPLLTEDGPGHDSVLYGYFGKDINWTDGRYTYCRQPEPDSICHLHTTCPMQTPLIWQREALATAEAGPFLPHYGDIPVWRIPLASSPHRDAPDRQALIFDIEADPDQTTPIDQPTLEAELTARLRETMARFDAPPSQYPRVGL